MMQKSTKCIALLASLLLLSAGLNYIFIGIAGGRAIKQTQQVQRARSTPQQTFAVECAPELKHC
jgi:hypothetical protein